MAKHSKYRCWVVWLVALCAPTMLVAQQQIVEPAELSRMIQAYRLKHTQQEHVRAWTIQVAASSNRRAVENEQARFRRVFPQYRVEWVHDDPYYILKMPDVAFLHKLDALHLLHEIKRRYSSSAILILDDMPRQKILESSNL